MSPGEMPLTRMWSGANSWAKAMVRPRTASFETEYGVPLRYDAIDEMLTMVPPPRAAMDGLAVTEQLTTPMTFTSNSLLIKYTSTTENGWLYFVRCLPAL